MTFTANKVTVTPELARQWLDSSKGNRKLNKNNLAGISADMLSGNWKYNGDRIRFLEDGTLHDGHHRLTACVNTGVTITTDTFVMEAEATSTVDKGRNRTTADYLAMNRSMLPATAAIVSSAVRIMIKHDNVGLLDWGSVTGVSSSHAIHLTETKVFEYYDNNRLAIDDACDWLSANISRAGVLVPRSQLVAVIVMASRIYDKDTVLDFINSVFTGHGITGGSTQDHVRNILISAKMKNRKMSAQQRLYTVVKCLNSFCAGRSIKHIGNAVFKPTAEAIPRLDK